MLRLHPGRVLRRFSATLDAFDARLARLPDAAFAAPGPGGGWTAGQVADHVHAVTRWMLDEALCCERGEASRRPPSLPATVLFLFGRLPPLRFEVPPGGGHKSDPEPLSREAARARLAEQRRALAAAVPRVAGASSRLRREKAVLGWMSARQWFALAELHARHHLSQLDRLGSAVQDGAP